MDDEAELRADVQAKTVLEIGMFTGTTTVSLAMVPSVERIVTLELEQYLESNNRPYFEQSGVADKIDIRIGDASALLDELVEQKASFDMVRQRRCVRDTKLILC